MGHSMGSFIARDYIAKYGDELNGVTSDGLLWFPMIVQFAMAMIHATVDPHCEAGSSLRVNTQL